jgi:NDP-sugar pyrophosphorylase family protein
MTAIILAGGKGTRLKPFTITVPKPLLPIGDFPIIEIVIRQLAAAGFTRIVVTVGHMAPLLVAMLGDGRQWGVTIEYSHETEPLGTVGPVRRIERLPESFLVMNGDIFTTLSFSELMLVHKRRDVAATIAVTRRQVAIDYGVVEASGGLLSNYIEKPTIDYSVSMGINVLSREAVDLIPKDRPFDMPQLMLALKRSGESVQCWDPDCYWQDIGRFDDYQQASADFVADPGRFLPSCSLIAKRS